MFKSFARGPLDPGTEGVDLFLSSYTPMDRSRKHFDIQERKRVKDEAGLPLSINDLREKEFTGKSLTEEEREAINNFDNYRIEYLNASRDEEEFHQRYMKMQVKANLSPYDEFLYDEGDEGDF